MRLLCLLPLLALIGCGSSANKTKAEADAPVTPVDVARAERAAIDRVISADAVLYPVNQSAITPKLSAPVRRFLVNRGDHVHAGQLLAELEDRDLVASANENNALYRQAEAQFQTTTKGQIPEDMTKAQADVESARQTFDAAKKLYENRVKLVQEGALAQKLADDAKVAMVQAQSALETAQRHQLSLQTVSRAGQIQSAQSGVDAARARYANAQAQVSYSKVVSPINGTVSDRPNFAGEMASPGTPLITVVDTSEIVARANVPVRDAKYLKKGQAATIAAPDGEITGAVSVVSPAVDPASTTVEIWVRAKNPANTIRPGVTAKVSIKAETIPDAIVIPASALLSSDEGENTVMVVSSDSTAHERKVELGLRQADRIQIESGLKEGEVVVTSGGVGLADKAKVEVNKPGEKTDAKDAKEAK